MINNTKKVLFYSTRYYSSFNRLRSPYEILSLKETATDAEIKQRYKELAMKFHPDKKPTGNLAQFQEIARAYEALKNPNNRLLYSKTTPTWSETASDSSYEQPTYNHPPSSGYTNATCFSLVAAAVLAIATFNLFYFQTSRTTLLNAADRHHLKSSEDLKKARTEARMFGNERSIKRVIENFKEK